MTILAGQGGGSERPDPLQGKYQVLPNGCWLWTRAKQSRGYGAVTYHGRLWLAHRLAYQLWVQPVPPGHDVFQTCGNRLCVNPTHLATEPHAVHAVVHDTPVQRNKRKTHCLRGHPFTPENTFLTRRGQRQ
jgi:hypothetical protein